MSALIVNLRSLILPAMAAVALGWAPFRVEAQAARDFNEKCNALASVDFSAIPDAITQVLETAPVASTEDSPGYCQVSGYVAPSFGFLLRMPAEGWNGKFIELGCGGPCGSTKHIASCKDPLRRGYACIVSDGGHKANGDVKWAYGNAHAPLDYFVLASHVTALAGKAIVERYYERRPGKSYFMGCSAGGMQAMFAAQRFPWDFDGIVAGGPALQLTGTWISWLWGNRALHDDSGQSLFSAADLELLHRAVVAKCDLNDGIEDGLIGDPRQCGFQPAQVRCAAGKIDRCLTERQIEAVGKIYGGAVTSKGEQIALPTAMKGSELTWLSLYGGTSAKPTLLYSYIGDWFRYGNFWPNPGPAWQPRDFDFDRDYRRMGMAEGWDPAQNHDLRRFKAVGGKLLMYTGWNDAIEGVLRTADYYETAEKLAGGRAATQDFFRLFVVPGMNHCGGGEGASVIDYLGYLEAWVERGQAPALLVGSHVKADAGAVGAQFPFKRDKDEFSRPIYPYPMVAKYRGSGDPNDPASYRPVAP